MKMSREVAARCICGRHSGHHCQSGHCDKMRLRTNQSERVGDQLIRPLAGGMIADNVQNQRLVRSVRRSDGLDAVLDHLRVPMTVRHSLTTITGVGPLTVKCMITETAIRLDSVAAPRCPAMYRCSALTASVREA
jgi:hypothetical protein